MSMCRILRITDCPIPASGKYKCATCSAETICTLKVVNVNKFVKDLENLTVFETESAKFECQLVDDEASVTWWFGGQQIEQSER